MTDTMISREKQLSGRFSLFFPPSSYWQAGAASAAGHFCSCSPAEQEALVFLAQPSAEDNLSCVHGITFSGHQSCPCKALPFQYQSTGGVFVRMLLVQHTVQLH